MISRVNPTRKASRKRRLIRLRLTAFPFLRVTVKPTRGGVFALISSGKLRLFTSSKKNGPRRFCPVCNAKNSALLRRRQKRFSPIGKAQTVKSGVGNCRQTPIKCPLSKHGSPVEKHFYRPFGLHFLLCRKTFATTCAAGSNNFASTKGCHTGTKTVAAFTNEFGRLICTFHLFNIPRRAALLGSMCGFPL